jgi:hypothetical protein
MAANDEEGNFVTAMGSGGVVGAGLAAALADCVSAVPVSSPEGAGALMQIQRAFGPFVLTALAEIVGRVDVSAFMRMPIPPSCGDCPRNDRGASSFGVSEGECAPVKPARSRWWKSVAVKE